MRGTEGNCSRRPVGWILAAGLLVAAAAACGAGRAGDEKPAITALRATPDGKGLLYGSQAGVVYQEPGGKSAALETALDHVLAFAFSEDGKRLAIAGGSPADKGKVEILSWPGRKLLATLEGHADLVHDVLWLPGSGCWATASADRTVRIWDGVKYECTQTLKGHSGPVFALALSPDGKLLCSGSGDQTIRVWKTESWEAARTLNNHLGAVHGLAFRPQHAERAEAELASASDDGTLRIWRPAIGRMVRIVRHASPVYSLAWNAEGTQVWTGARDGRVRIVDAESDQILKEIAASKSRIESLTLAGKSFFAGDSRGNVIEVKE